MHDCTDVSACDPRRYPSTNILITSPECKTHTPAGGNSHKKLKEQMDMFNMNLIDPATERSRATMWDVCRFAEYHDYEVIIVENVVEAKTTWPLFETWLKAMDVLGYKHKCCYFNSMHFLPTPQSRDRMYIVFWKKGNPAPDLDYSPRAFCHKCCVDVSSIQSWKNPMRRYGKYKTQYIYCCPSCASKVEPYYYASFNVINWADRGKRIGDRRVKLSPNTLKRIEHGREKYWNKDGYMPLIINDQQSTGIGFRVKGAHQNFDCITTQPSFKVVMPFIIKLENTSNIDNNRSSVEPFKTQSTCQSDALIIPWIIEMNSTGECKPSTDHLSSITAGGINHAILQTPLIVQNKGQSKSKPATEPFGTLTTKPSNGIITDDSMNSFINYYYGNGNMNTHITSPFNALRAGEGSNLITNLSPDIEDCYYRMIKAPEVKLGMAFDKDYIVLGSQKDQVKQCGNAVTPPVMQWIAGQCIKSLS